MSFLVDTVVVSAHLRGHRSVSTMFLQYTGGLHVSAVTLAESKTWLYRSSTPKKFRDSFELLADDLLALDVDEVVAEAFGRIGAKLYDDGWTLPTPDLLIACTAIVHNLTLVTSNTQRFSPIPGLRIENWLD